MKNINLTRFVLIYAAMTGISAVSVAEGPLHWVGTWAAAPHNLTVPEAARGMADTTYRNVVHISLGGSNFRVQLTNEFGVSPLKVDGAHIAISSGNGGLRAGTDHELTFNGKPSVTIPAGAMIVSDSVSMEAPPFADLAVSIFVPAQTIKVMTIHPVASSTNYKMAGDLLTAETLDKKAEVLPSWYLLKGVEVASSPDAAAVVTLGDSITDGVSSTRNANHRWPDVLAARLQKNKTTSNLGVLNEGMSGNRVLNNFNGPNALSRIDRDVIAQTGVKYLIVLESINDIGRNTVPMFPDQIVTVQQLIFGFSQLVLRAHEHNIKVFGATVTPYEGASYFSEAGEKDRQAINTWIRTSGVFDGVIDFDKVVRDPVHPSSLMPIYDDGHHLHPNDMGYKAMGNAVNLALFQ